MLSELVEYSAVDTDATRFMNRIENVRVKKAEHTERDVVPDERRKLLEKAFSESER